MALEYTSIKFSLKLLFHARYFVLCANKFLERFPYEKLEQILFLKTKSSNFHVTTRMSLLRLTR